MWLSSSCETWCSFALKHFITRRNCHWSLKFFVFYFHSLNLLVHSSRKLTLRILDFISKHQVCHILFLLIFYDKIALFYPCESSIVTAEGNVYFASAVSIDDSQNHIMLLSNSNARGVARQHNVILTSPFEMVARANARVWLDNNKWNKTREKIRAVGRPILSGRERRHLELHVSVKKAFFFLKTSFFHVTVTDFLAGRISLPGINQWFEHVFPTSSWFISISHPLSNTQPLLLQRRARGLGRQVTKTPVKT